MTMSIGMHMNLLGNGLWTLYEIDSMWNSWDMHIGLCQSGFLI